MGIHWKSKQTQKNLMGKSTLAHKSGNLSPVLQAISPELVCPSGEQIVNGGFETGDLTGWTTSNIGVGKGEVLSVNPYEGIYHFRLYDLPYGSPSPSIAQNFKELVSSECLTDTSTFQVALKSYTDFSPPIGGWVDIYLVYTNGTETHIHVEDVATYTVYDLKPYVESGKTLKGIRLENTTPLGTSFYIDIDEVSLIP
jgi:hypothetical protein